MCRVHRFLDRSPQLPSEGFTPNWSHEGFWRQSLRQVVRLSAGGDRLRVRLTHAYGASPVRVAAASVGRTAAGAGVAPGSLVRLTFGGAGSAAIPARGELVSDDVPLAVAAGDSVTVTLDLCAVELSTGYRPPSCRSPVGGCTSLAETWRGRAK